MSEFQTKLNSVPSGGFLTDRDKDKKGPVSDEGVRNRSGGYSCDYLYPGSSRGDAGAV